MQYTSFTRSCSRYSGRVYRMHPSISLLSLLPAVVNVDASFDFTQHLGILTPPFTPSFGLDGGLGSGMPSVCSLEQVQVVSTGVC